MNSSKILCIDDNDRNLRILRELLESDYALECAQDGESGLDLLHEELPGLILLDVMMPGIDGYEVCRQVKKDPATAKIPIVLLTAKAKEDEKQIGFEAGADGYLMKPFDPDALIDLVESFVPVPVPTAD